MEAIILNDAKIKYSTNSETVQYIFCLALSGLVALAGPQIEKLRLQLLCDAASSKMGMEQWPKSFRHIPLASGPELVKLTIAGNISEYTAHRDLAISIEQNLIQSLQAKYGEKDQRVVFAKLTLARTYLKALQLTKCHNFLFPQLKFLDGTHPETPPGMRSLLLDIGMAYDEMGSDPEAVKLLYLASLKFQQQDPGPGATSILNLFWDRIADACEDLGQVQEANKYYLLAASKIKSDGATMLSATRALNVARTYNELGNFKMGLKYADFALLLTRKALNERAGEYQEADGPPTVEFGLAQAGLGQYREGIASMRKGMEYMTDQNDKISYAYYGDYMRGRLCFGQITAKHRYDNTAREILEGVVKSSENSMERASGGKGQRFMERAIRKLRKVHDKALQALSTIY